MNNKSKQDSIFEKLKLMKECPLCSQSYKYNNVAVLEESKQGHLVHITCSKCWNSIMAVVMISPIGMNTIGIITDLSAKEAVNLRKRLAVSEDDVLSFHKFIQNPKKFEKVIMEN